MATPLRILSLDGGGVRGKSALLILEAIMEKVRDELGQETTPLPCEYFDLIGGTSTGGLIAIMLGRLQMSIGECIEAYDNLATKAFKEKSGLKLPGPPKGIFSATALQEALVTVIEQNCKEDGCRGIAREARKCEHSSALFRHHHCCKTVVLAITKDNVDTLPTLFKTYDTSDSLKDCKIWEVGRATSAATTFFKSMTCGRDNIEFIDAGFGYNNPCAVLIREAQTTFPGREFACILSIGTGLGGVVTIKDKRIAILNALKKMASSSKRVADELADILPDSIYYRFNVTRGMEDVSLSDVAKISSISAHSRNYIRDVQKQLSACSAALQKPPRDARVEIRVPDQGGEDGETGSMHKESRRPRLRHIDEETTETRTLKRKALQPLPFRGKISKTSVENPVSDLLTASQSKQEAPFLVPFGRDDQFVGREDIMIRIDSILETKPRVALAGVGGVGKSQVAIEYSYRYRAKYPFHHVFWVHASTAERFDQAYRDIARRLNLPGWNDPNADNLQIVCDWLNDGDYNGWLIILDNADDENVFFGLRDVKAIRGRHPLFSYLPQVSKGRVIITSRNRNAAFRLINAPELIIDVSPMGAEDAENLLKRKLPHDQSSDTVVNELLETLEYLPLAITQAAAYIGVNHTRFTVSKYLAYLRKNEDILLKDMGDLRRDHDVPNSVLKTWQVSFDQIKNYHPQAADLLSLMSVLDRQGIPEFLFCDDDTRLDFEDALAPLNAFSLITSETDGKMLGMHRLVQLATRTWLTSRNAISKWEDEAMKLLSKTFPFGEYENLNLCRTLLPHVEAVLRFQFSDQLQLLGQADIAHNLAWHLKSDGRYHLAMEEIERALVIYRRFLNEEDRVVLRSRHLQALLFYGQGKFEEAERIYRRVLKSREKLLGSEHLQTLVSLNDLALVLTGQNKYEEAERNLRQVVEVQKRVLGQEHPSTLITLGNLGVTLNAQGKHKEAEEISRQVMEVQERVLGKEHPETMIALNNLGLTLNNQRKFEEAEEILRQVVEVRERLFLGKEHPGTMIALSNLGLTLNDQSKYEEAEKICRQILEARKRVLGKEHPSTLITLNNLGVTLNGQGKHKEAERILRQVMEVQERVLGKEHPHTLKSAYSLAATLFKKGNYAEAEELFQQTLEVKERELGKDHPETMYTVDYLAVLFHIRKQYHEAAVFYQRACAGFLKALGPNHRDTLLCLRNYEHMLKKMSLQNETSENQPEPDDSSLSSIISEGYRFLEKFDFPQTREGSMDSEESMEQDERENTASSESGGEACSMDTEADM